MFKYVDMAQNESTSTGTGDFTLDPPGPGDTYQDLATVLSTDDHFTYLIFNASASEWEIGIGLNLGSSVIRRVGVIRSSNSHALVNFSAGTKTVGLVPLASIGGHASAIYGDGSDGDVSVTGASTLARDMFYRNLTISGSGALTTAGYKIYVSDVLDLSAANAGSIIRNGINGTNAANTIGGGSGGNMASATLGNGQAAGSGPNGTTGAGSQASAIASFSPANGGQAGAGGKGGDGAGGANAGGASRSGTPPAGALSIRYYSDNLFKMTASTTLSLLLGGCGAPGGSGAAGDGGSAGGSGGGGGGGGVVAISARIIKRSGSTAAACINVKGGNGGNGANTIANRGGGAGGGGGGGGWVYLAYENLIGSTATDAIAADGGTGGNAGNTAGTGTGGHGGSGGFGGRITVLALGTGVTTEVVGTGGTAGNANSGTTGGTGGAGESLRVTL